MVNNVTPVDTAAAVDLEMDLEVKSEPESDDDTFNCNVSETSSIEEVCKPEHPISDEELEEEPLIEMESVIVPQELVKDELEPNLLLFVKKEEPGPVKISTCSSAYFKRSTSKDDKCTQTDAVSELSVTKALRNVKRTRKNYSHSTSGQNVRKTNKKNNVKAAKTKTLSFKPLKADFEVELSLIRSRTNTKPNLCTKLAKNSLKLFRKKVEVTKNKLPKVISGVKLKSNFSKQINSELEEENLANPVPSKLQINKSFSKEVAEKEAYKFFSDSKGKENTQCNNEDENTADTVFSSDNCELNDSNNGKSSENSKETSKPNSYDCTICGKQFREKSHLATHARAHNDIRNFKCNECGLLFKTKTNLYYHTKTHGAPFTCSKCNKTFIQKKMFTRHMRVVHSGEGLHNCDICGRSFKSAQNLELHYTLHTGNKPFSCNICRKSFVYKSTYRAHMKAHEADEQFNCEVCLAAGTQDKGELRRRCHHHSQARPWLCTVCGKGYPLKATLKNHMKSHDAEKPFKCEECGKCFVKRQTYESHVKTHSGQKPEYMCDQCSQSYYSFVSLKRHYMKHTGERNFVCDMCNKAFWTKDAMKVHRRSHENVKTFQCTQCSKAFAHKHTLVAHMRAHSGETLHSCDVCCKTFLHKYHLTRHLRQHSSTYPPLAASLYMLPPHSHMDMPTLQIL